MIQDGLDPHNVHSKSEISANKNKSLYRGQQKSISDGCFYLVFMEKKLPCNDLKTTIIWLIACSVYFVFHPLCFN